MYNRWENYTIYTDVSCIIFVYNLILSTYIRYCSFSL